MIRISNPGGRSSATPSRRKRKTPAHFPALESGFRSILIFLTVCTDGRRPLLANQNAANLITNAWQVASFWVVGRYVIMPNHVHLFCTPNTFPTQSLTNWIAFWKNHVTRAWPDRKELPIWQRDYWDRQLRKEESYSAKWHYVENNPVRHGYVVRAEDWSYRGELNILNWHDR